MSVKLSNGTIIETTNLNRLSAITSELAKEQEINHVQVSEIFSVDGVTIKVDNLQMKKKSQPGFEYENYIEIKHKNKYGDYLIRVWRYDEEKVFGCNCIGKGELFRYMEFYYFDYRDENAVFKFVKNWLDDGHMINN